MKKKLHEILDWFKRKWESLQESMQESVSYDSITYPHYTMERYSQGSGACLTRRPEIWISPEDHQRLFGYMSNCPQEISGLGYAHLDKLPNGDLLLSNPMLFEQEVNFNETDLSQGDIGKFMFEMVKSGGDPENLKMWWHSHGSGSVFWSKHQDEKTIANLRRFGMEFLVSIVGNHFGDYLLRLDIFKPVHVTIDNIPLRIIQVEDLTLQAEILAEIEKKVSGYKPRGKSSVFRIGA